MEPYSDGMLSIFDGDQEGTSTQMNTCVTGEIQISSMDYTNVLTLISVYIKA